MKQQDEPAFAELHRRFSVPLLNAAFQRLQDKDLCKELLQNLFVTLWLKREQFPDVQSVGGCLFTAPKNRVIEQYRPNARRAELNANRKITQNPAY